MDTRLQYFGELRRATFVGTLRGRNVYTIEMGKLHPSRVLVRDSVSPSTLQTVELFVDARDVDVELLLCIEWAANPEATATRTWIADRCRKRSTDLLALSNLLAPTEPVQ